MPNIGNVLIKSGSQAGPSGGKFVAGIGLRITEIKPAQLRLEYYAGIQVVSGSLQNTVISYSKNINGTKSTGSASVNSSGWYGDSSWKELGYFNAGDTINLSMDAYYTGSSGTQYKSTVSGSYTVPSQKTISYDANGGQTTPVSSQTWSDEIIYIASKEPTRTNYNFICWNTKKDGSGTDYFANQEYSGTSSLLLYAQWELALALPAKPIVNSLAKSDLSAGAAEIEVNYSYVAEITQQQIDSLEIHCLISGEDDDETIFFPYSAPSGTTTTEGSLLIPIEHKNAKYEIYAVAKNAVGSTYSDPFIFYSEPIIPLDLISLYYVFVNTRENIRKIVFDFSKLTQPIKQFELETTNGEIFKQTLVKNKKWENTFVFSDDNAPLKIRVISGALTEINEETYLGTYSNYFLIENTPTKIFNPDLFVNAKDKSSNVKINLDSFNKQNILKFFVPE